MRVALGRSLVSHEAVITRISAAGVQAGNSTAMPATSSTSARPVSALSLASLSPETTLASALATGVQACPSLANVLALAAPCAAGAAAAGALAAPAVSASATRFSVLGAAAAPVVVGCAGWPPAHANNKTDIVPNKLLMDVPPTPTRAHARRQCTHGFASPRIITR